jgi:hypothetical protein
MFGRALGCHFKLKVQSSATFCCGCVRQKMARNGRANCWLSYPLLEVYLPRQQVTAEAVDDP